jgi:hypothetical protein
MRHVGHDGKQSWLGEIRSRFNQLRNSPPSLSNVLQLSRRQLIDTFAYGARILHRESSNDSETALAELVRECGREEVVMAIHSSLRDFEQCAIQAYHPIKQDFEHWVENCGCARPDRVDLTELLRSR